MGRLEYIIGLGTEPTPSLEVRRHAYREWCYSELASVTGDLGATEGRARFLRSLRGMDLSRLTQLVIEAREARADRTRRMMAAPPHRSVA